MWCHFEALKTADLGKGLRLMMADDELVSSWAMCETLAFKFKDITNVVSSVDAAKANATAAAKDLVLGLFNSRQGGVSKCHADLTSALRVWLLGAARKQLVAAVCGEAGDGE